MAWPVHFPSLNPLDFLIWSYLKSLIYKTLICIEKDILARIIASFIHVEANTGIFHVIHKLTNRRRGTIFALKQKVKIFNYCNFI